MLVSRTRAILRNAEFGFLGVIVRTCRHTPRFWGAPGIGSWRCFRLFQFFRIAGALIFDCLGVRPLRTSWLIVGTNADSSWGSWSWVGTRPCCEARCARRATRRDLVLSGRCEPGVWREPLRSCRLGCRLDSQDED